MARRMRRCQGWLASVRSGTGWRRGSGHKETVRSRGEGSLWCSSSFGSSPGGGGSSSSALAFIECRINGSTVSRLKLNFPLPRFNSSAWLPPCRRTEQQQWAGVYGSSGLGGWAFFHELKKPSSIWSSPTLITRLIAIRWHLIGQPDPQIESTVQVKYCALTRQINCDLIGRLEIRELFMLFSRL
jgi:hypothetical protein